MKTKRMAFKLSPFDEGYICTRHDATICAKGLFDCFVLPTEWPKKLDVILTTVRPDGRDFVTLCEPDEYTEHDDDWYDRGGPIQNYHLAEFPHTYLLMSLQDEMERQIQDGFRYAWLEIDDET